MKLRDSLVCLAVLGALAFAATAHAGGKTGAPESWSGAELDADGDVRIVVMYRDGLSPQALEAKAGRSPDVRARRTFRRLGGELLKVAPDRLAETVAELEADSDVLVAEPDRRSLGVQAQKVPWGITRIHADPASRGPRSGAGVKVAVLDTGIWNSPATGAVHPDLAAVYKGGYDFVSDDQFPWDGHGHGTHVAGTLAAVDNGLGVVGAAPGVSLYALKVFDDLGKGYFSDFIAGLDWCIGHGIVVANFSGGGIDRSATIETACIRARAAGVTLFAAAGNSYSGLLVPAIYPSVVSVGATDQGNAHPPWSNIGGELDLSAPGVNVLSTYRDNGYTPMDGTSMATPHAAGVAALLVGRGISYPDLVQDYLQSTATDLGTAGRDWYFGSGLVNAGQGVPARPKIVAPAAGAALTSGTVVRIDWDPVPGAATYRVLFSRSAAGTWKQIVASTAKTARLWKVPAVNSPLAGCRVQIAAYDAFSKLIGVNTIKSLTIRP